MEAQQVADVLWKEFAMSPEESSVFVVTFGKNDGDFGSGVDGEQKCLIYVFHETNGIMFVADEGSASGWRCLWRVGGASSRDFPKGRIIGADCVSYAFGNCVGNEENAHIVDPRDHASILQMFSADVHVDPIELASSDHPTLEVLISYFEPALREDIPQEAASAGTKAPKKKPSEPRQPKWIQDKIYASRPAFAANPETHEQQFIPIKPLWHHLIGFLEKYNVPPEGRPKTDADRDVYVGRMPPGLKKEYLQYEGEKIFDRDLRESKAHNTLWAHLTRYDWVAKRPTIGPNAPWTPKLSDYVPAPDS